MIRRAPKSRPLEGLAESHATGANFQPFLLVGPTRFLSLLDLEDLEMNDWRIELRNNLYTVMVYHGNLIL